MERFTGFLGVIFILGISYLFSNNRKAINYILVLKGLLLQVAIAFFILKTHVGLRIFQKIGIFITHIIEKSSRSGADFVFGVLVRQEILSDKLGPEHAFIFFFNITATVILICVLVEISYHLGIMQRLVFWVARIVHRVMGISGVEAISNVASAFVGQVEAQIMIKPYLKGMTLSELLASMSGSMACIAGGVMVVYIGFGIPAEYLISASLMAAPAALVISKIVYPEIQESETKKNVKLAIEKESSNILDVISHSCSDGLKISLNISAMLIGFMALATMIDLFLSELGSYLTISNLSMSYILGKLFFPLAWLMGIPSKDIDVAGSLMGTKLIINEFVAYLQLKDLIAMRALDTKTITILSVALCGFANIGSIGIQIGGIGELVPDRRKDLSSLAWYALLCGTLTSYLSATIAGLLMS